MAQHITIALDVMSGESGLHACLQGAEDVLSQRQEIRFLLFGDEVQISASLNRFSKLRQQSEIRHCETIISMSDSPLQALRKGSCSSMWRAVDAIKQEEAQGVVSCGNTGAFMVISKNILGTLSNVDRTAIAIFTPTIGGELILMDIGANIDTKLLHYLQYAVMGNIYSRVLFGLEKPRIGVLNVGVEANKGHKVIRILNKILKDSPLNFIGSVEGDALTMSHNVDVIITDGFTGNIAVKAMEGVARYMMLIFKKAFQHSILSRIGYLLLRNSLKDMQEAVNPDNHNGAMFIGLKGIVVKSHGSASAAGITHAINKAIYLIVENVLEKMIKEFEHINVKKMMKDNGYE